MPEDHLIIRTALDHAARPGRFGKAASEPAVSLVERTGFSIASIAARKGRAAATGEAVKSAFGIDLPITPRREERNGIAFVWAGPEKWLAVAKAKGDFAATICNAVAGTAAVTDQSDGRSIIALGGARARDVLAKGLPIDLHPRVFHPGDTALTRAAHIDVQIWQLDERPSYEIVLLRSFARSFWRWLTASAAAYGYEVLPRT